LTRRGGSSEDADAGDCAEEDYRPSIVENFFGPPAEEERRDLEAMLERVLVRMQSERRIASEEERDRLRELYDRWEFDALPWDLESDDAPNWHDIDAAITTLPSRSARSTRPTAAASHGNRGGRPYKRWPQPVLAEATRLWVKGAYHRSARRIAEVVNETKVSGVDKVALAAHGYADRPLKFGRDAMALVVAAVERGDLSWDETRGLRVFRQFPASAEWIEIPHEPAP
jgi:hypothetical protein